MLSDGTARFSATNCAKVYDMALSGRETCRLGDVGWQFGFKLKTEHIWDAFVLLSLLRDREIHSRQLKLPHKGLQKDRLTEAMQERNLRIVTEGQDEIAHSCDKCTRDYKTTDADGVVTWRKSSVTSLKAWFECNSISCRCCSSSDDRWRVH